MGTVITLDYGAMKEAYRKAKKASSECELYAKKIDSNINKKINNLKMGSNSNTSQANYFAKQKISALNSKKSKLDTYSSKIDTALSHAKDTDAKVSKFIRTASKDFRKNNDMKVGVIEELFAWVTTTLLNSTAFGRWLNQVFRDVGTWIDNAKRIFKNWYELEGGKYIIKVALAVVGTIIAVIFLVVVAWPALVAAVAAIGAAGLAGLTGAAVWTLVTAAAAFATAVIAVTDGVTKCISSTAAAASFGDDPGWAKRYSSYTSASEALRKHNFKSDWMDKQSGGIANVIDGITIVAAVINIADLAHSGINAIKQIKSNGTARYFNKVRFKSPSGKITINTVKYGIKNIMRNAGEFKKLVTATNISRMHTYYENSSKLHDVYKYLKTGEKVIKYGDSFFDKGVAGTGFDEIKSRIQKKSTLHEYGSKTVDTAKKIDKFIDAQKPAYSF